MEHYYSKKSSIRDNAIVYEALDRGHQSEVSRLKKSNKLANMSGRRLFTFAGTAGKITMNPPSNVKSRTPSKAATPKTRTPKSRQVHRSRSRSTLRNKLLSSVQKSTIAKRDRSRSASLAGSHREAVHNQPSSSVKNQPPSKSVTPIVVEIASPQNDTVSPAVLIDEDAKPDTKEIKEELVSPAVVIPSISSSDEDDKDEEEDVSTSPSVVGYRKLVYDEPRDKWIEYWKLEEDLKRARKKEKTQKILEKWRLQKEKPKVHPIKGKITAKMQVMFPTAIVKQDRRHGQYYQNILMTDPLRVELYKRRAPIVPTYYQEHIVKFGKLPFRNNPRPHPIV